MHEQGHDEPRWLMRLYAVGIAVVAVSLLVLRVDLRHNSPGGPPPAFVVVDTPNTYGPPPTIGGM